ncbi:cytoskeleton protein RodZ [Photobacterium sp. SDRW27]|uniref:cytoskeleton protein RodZ n=1 Tax=Photobacterium obscurum TaxID=2829490 RepID=UPI0022448EFE|nr:cytoskeleton protein RodZ [Photobacterium obscurum]MCW8328044.1 cytoskeleton protein RodZ [Photobacterium obscurum]
MNTEQNEDRSTEEVIRPGDMLRQAREQHGYSQEDIASRLRLRLSVINDIEDNNFEQAQLATFTRGYVRSYAKFVGLNVEEVLAKLDQHGHAQPQAQQMQSFSRRTKREAHDNRIMRLTWALAIIFVGLTGVWWWQSLQMEPETETLDPASQQIQPLDESLANANTSAEMQNGFSATEISATAEGSALAAVEAEIIETSVEPEPVEASSFEDSFSTEAETSALISEETDSADSLAAQQAPDVITEAESVAVESDLTLTFSGDCWVDIRDANGKRLDTGVKKPGDVLNLDGAAPFKVVLGAPGVVKMSYKGEPVDLSGYPVGKVARLKLPQ